MGLRKSISLFFVLMMVLALPAFCRAQLDEPDPTDQYACSCPCQKDGCPGNLTCGTDPACGCVCPPGKPFLRDYGGTPVCCDFEGQKPVSSTACGCPECKQGGGGSIGGSWNNACAFTCSKAGESAFPIGGTSDCPVYICCSAVENIKKYMGQSFCCASAQQEIQVIDNVPQCACPTCKSGKGDKTSFGGNWNGSSCVYDCPTGMNRNSIGGSSDCPLYGCCGVADHPSFHSPTGTWGCCAAGKSRVYRPSVFGFYCCNDGTTPSLEDPQNCCGNASSPIPLCINGNRNVDDCGICNCYTGLKSKAITGGTECVCESTAIYQGCGCPCPVGTTETRLGTACSCECPDHDMVYASNCACRTGFEISPTNPKLCQCSLPNCSSQQYKKEAYRSTTDPKTCGCQCPQASRDYCAQRGASTDDKCQCVCSSPKVWSSSAQACVCSSNSTCKSPATVDPLTCACSCPDQTKQSKCTGNNPKGTWNGPGSGNQSCSCSCPTGSTLQADGSCQCTAILCPQGQTLSTSTCSCVCDNAMKNACTSSGGTWKNATQKPACSCACPTGKTAGGDGKCVCSNSCTSPQVLDAGTCGCYCPQSNYQTLAAACTASGSGGTWVDAQCRCDCTLNGNQRTLYNSTSGACECPPKPSGLTGPWEQVAGGCSYVCPFPFVVHPQYPQLCTTADCAGPGCDSSCNGCLE